MKRVLSIGAHPDDIELGCGGTELWLKERGYELVRAFVTSGEAGDRHMPKAELARLREAEARDSAKTCGVAEVVFLGEPDGLTHFTEKQRARVIDLIRRVRPEILFVHASHDTFPDHQVVHQLVLSALTGAAGPWFQETSGEPHTVTHVYGYEVWHPIPSPQLTVPIGAFLEKKLESLRAYRSQIEAVDYVSAARGLAAYRGVTSLQKEPAEAFEVIRTSLGGALS